MCYPTPFDFDPTNLTHFPSLALHLFPRIRTAQHIFTLHQGEVMVRVKSGTALRNISRLCISPLRGSDWLALLLRITIIYR